MIAKQTKTHNIYYVTFVCEENLEQIGYFSSLAKCYVAIENHAKTNFDFIYELIEENLISKYYNCFATNISKININDINEETSCGEFQIWKIKVL